MKVEISLGLNCLFQLLFTSSYSWGFCRFLEKDITWLRRSNIPFLKRHKTFAIDVKYSFKFKKVKFASSVVA